MTWLAYVFFGVVAAGFVAFARTQDASPLAPYAVAGSYPAVAIKNYSDDTLRIFAIAPRVDQAIRWMGLVPPHDSAFLRIPYASTKVTLLCFTSAAGGFLFEKTVP